MSSDWEQRATVKRQQILDAIPPDWRIADLEVHQRQTDITGDYLHRFLSTEEIDMTETDAVGIAEKVASGTWTAESVAQAFCHRASIAHQLLNCLHEIFFDDAMTDARELDRFYHEHGHVKGPLHGVPVSLKDQFHIKNVETTMGYVGWIGTFQGIANDSRYRSFESDMVRELRGCGAVLYCKTSVPHTLMSGETVNNIIGYTWNPKNRNFSSGGSSGGEGALIGARGSSVGLGTDIGGSIRIPAAFNGLYGLRPTSGRLPYQGMANSMDGQNSVLSVVGPLATTARGLRLLTRSLLSTKPWLYDPGASRIPWSTEEEQYILDRTSPGSATKLAFGMIRHDGVVEPTPPVARAIDMVAKALREQGHDIIEWQPPAHDEINRIVGNAFVYDADHDTSGAFGLSGEPVASQVLKADSDEEWSASRIAANNVAKRDWQKRYMDYWNSTASLTATGQPVDGVISPVAPFCAARPTKYYYYGYTMWINGLDQTSVVFPVTTVDKELDRYAEGWRATNDTEQLIYDDYNSDLAHGAHVSLQVVGRRHEEEKMIALGQYIGSLVGR